jgi:hypothetical protein
MNGMLANLADAVTAAQKTLVWQTFKAAMDDTQDKATQAAVAALRAGT